MRKYIYIFFAFCIPLVVWPQSITPDSLNYFRFDKYLNEKTSKIYSIKNLYQMKIITATDLYHIYFFDDKNNLIGHKSFLKNINLNIFQIEENYFFKNTNNYFSYNIIYDVSLNEFNDRKCPRVGECVLFNSIFKKEGYINFFYKKRKVYALAYYACNPTENEKNCFKIRKYVNINEKIEYNINSNEMQKISISGKRWFNESINYKKIFLKDLYLIGI